MKNIFLTGDIQVGKSTLINKVLENLNIKLGGFKTFGDNYTKNGESDIVISSVCSDESYIAAHRGNCGNTVFNDVFNTYGVEFLKFEADLIIMDELGYLESDAIEFQKAVLNVLDSDKPVLGVVRNKQTPFLDEVRSNKNTELIIVTPKNRDMLYEIVLKKIRELLK